MIIFAAILAFLDVFIVSQLSFWGAVPVLFTVVLYMFRYEAIALELVVAAAVYGFIISSFTTENYGLVLLTSITIASAIAVFLHRLVRQSRLRIRMRGYDAALISVVFSFGYWLILVGNSFGAVNLEKTMIVILWSIVINLVLMLSSDIVYRKISRG